MASLLSERGLIGIISSRLDRSPDDFDIRLCAAAVSAAMRVVDEDISLAAIARGEVFTLPVYKSGGYSALANCVAQ